MKEISRRKFLETGAVGSAAVIAGVTVKFPILQQQGETPKQVAVSSALEAPQRDVLHSAMDEIIPAGDGMPAASEVGGMDYLDQLTAHYPKVADALRKSLSALETLSQSRLQASFAKLTHAQRVEVLTAMDKQDAANFKVLRDCVYEAYYTQPAVWKLIGYELYPTNGPGPRKKKVFHEEVLAEVRKKPKGYREVA